MPESFIDMGEVGSAASDRLRQTIVELNETTAKQTAQVVRLTSVLVFLTAFLVLGLVIQIVLAIR